MKAVAKLAAYSLLAFTTSSSVAVTGFLQGERDQALSKICFYDVLGETHTLNVSSVSLCPLSYDFNAIPQAPGQFDPGSGKTGFLQGERQQGLSKICYYDVLGETYALTVGAVDLCPLNHQF